MKCKKFFVFIAILLSLACLIGPSDAIAQGDQNQGGRQAIRPEELDQMIAPIALYPDSLLAYVFMASTYPIEVVQADRFVKENKDLKGDKLMAVAKDKDWDPSIKSLLPFPEVLAMMSDKLDWTTKLGNAFLAQQRDIMDSVQRLRKKAYEAGNLKSTKEQVVKVEKQTVIIQPSNPEVIYVPAYNPIVVYGVWAYPAYPPYPYYPPGYGAAAATMGFAAGVVVGASACCWGNVNWGHNDIDINVNNNNNFINNNYNKETAQKYKQQAQSKRQQDGKTSWQHNPEHRKGAQYGNQATAQRYGQTRPTRAQQKQNFRGYDKGGAAGQAQRARPESPKGMGGQRGESAFHGMGNGGAERAASLRGQSSRGASGATGGFSRGGGGFSRGGGFKR